MFRLYDDNDLAQRIKQLIEQTPNHPLASFAVVYPQQVEWGDLDAFNHVNNVVYYDYAQRARIKHLQQVDLFNSDTNTVIAASSCQYQRPVLYPDTLLIGVCCSKIGNTSMTHDYVYFSTAQQAVVATATSVLVFFDDTGEKKRPISDAEKSRLQALDGWALNLPLDK